MAQQRRQLTDWLGQSTGGFTVNGANVSASVRPTGTSLATGDFNGDGRDDILWRNDNGACHRMARHLERRVRRQRSKRCDLRPDQLARRACAQRIDLIRESGLPAGSPVGRSPPSNRQFARPITGRESLSVVA